jgi:hypothetical protein
LYNAPAPDGYVIFTVPSSILNKPPIPATQVSSDWNATTEVAQILNKPPIPAAQVSSDWNATTGVAQILNKPPIPAAQVSSDWTATTGVAQILNKPPIPAAQVSSDWSATTGVSSILNKPPIPAAQVSSDWSATTGVAQILSKPPIPAAQVSSDWSATTGVAQILNKPAIITMTDINNTSNYTTRINTQLTTAISATQPKIISTAGQIIIGNGDGLTRTSTGLTWNTATLTATNLNTTTLLTTNNLAVSTQAIITQLLTAGQSADMLTLQNNANNSLRFQQVFQLLNDQKWILKQKSNNVDYNLFNFRNGKICVGTSANPAYMLDVVGDVNITGDFLKNASVYKPVNAVLADTATALATARTIAGTSLMERQILI